MATPPICATHTAFIYQRGGTVVVGELLGMTSIRWGRNRDDISTAQCHLIGNECCAVVENLGSLIHELHIFRDGVKVWEGVIVRLEFEYDGVDIYAEDMLWVAKRRVLEAGYDFRATPTSAVNLFHALATFNLYSKYGDVWNMVSHLHPVTHAGDPETARVINSYQTTVWSEMDKLAEDMGIDYTMVGRELYYFDVHLKWVVLPPLLAEHVSSFPRIVEYGNEFANRVVYTNGSGYAGIAQADSGTLDTYGRYVDLLVSVNNDGADNEPPSATQLQTWTENAQSTLSKRHPPPQSIVVPANSTLMPSCPWDVNTLMCGSWMQVQMDRMCRTLNEWQRLHSMSVTEDENGEKVQISCITAPATSVTP